MKDEKTPFQRLRLVLLSIPCKLLWTAQVHDGQLYFYTANGKTFIVREWKDGGFDIYVDSFPGKIDDCIEALRAYVKAA